MEKTVPNPYLNEKFLGYVLNSEFSEENKLKIQQLQQKLIERFGDAIWLPKPEWLHITLMDWLAPLVDYHRDKDDLFEEIRRPYNHALMEILAVERPIKVHFNHIDASSEAVFISGQDDGEYQRIRSAFLDSVELLPDTKRPSQIIHSTIARFNTPIDLSEVRQFVDGLSVSFEQVINEFRLLRTTDTKMASKFIVRKYKLDDS